MPFCWPWMTLMRHLCAAKGASNFTACTLIRVLGLILRHANHSGLQACCPDVCSRDGMVAESQYLTQRTQEDPWHNIGFRV